MEFAAARWRYVPVHRRFLWLALIALGLGVATLIYAGPGRALVRGHVGDIAAAMLVYAAVGFVWRAPVRLRAVTAFAIASAVELGQMCWHVTSLAGELTVGNTFDVVDLAAYGVGVALSLAWERCAAT